MNHLIADLRAQLDAKPTDRDLLLLLADVHEDSQSPSELARGLRWLHVGNYAPRLSGRESSGEHWHWTIRANRKEPQPSDLPFERLRSDLPDDVALTVTPARQQGSLGKYSSYARPWWRAHLKVSDAYMAAAAEFLVWEKERAVKAVEAAEFLAFKFASFSQQSFPIRPMPVIFSSLS